MMKRFLAIIPLAVLPMMLTHCVKKTVKEEKEEIKVVKLTPQERVDLALSIRSNPVELTGTEKAVVETNKGTFEFELYSEDTPNTVSNFVKLAEAGFFDGLIWHRYVEGFVIQGGDPQGTGYGDAGYEIDFEKTSKTHTEGAVGMARGPDINSASCQFYVCLAPVHQLDGSYVVFGQVTEGMDVVKELRAQDDIVKITIQR